jgi:diguanylate cyclase (GGDEF)-like protein
MALTASEAQSLTAAGGAVVGLIEGDELVYRAASGSERRSIGSRSPSKEGLEGNVVSEGKASRLGPVACAPLLRDGEVWGVVKVVSTIDHPFDDEDVATLEVISALSATCISHAFQFVAKAKESRLDAATGLGTGLSLGERLDSEIARSRRAGEPLSLVLLEIDDFESIDSTGPGSEEAVVQLVAGILKQGRASDIQFRLAAKQFAVLMPGTDRSGAEIAAIRLAWAIANAGNDLQPITVTTGVAQPAADDAYTFITDAEIALRESKALVAE